MDALRSRRSFVIGAAKASETTASLFLTGRGFWTHDFLVLWIQLVQYVRIWNGLVGPSSGLRCQNSHALGLAGVSIVEGIVKTSHPTMVTLIRMTTEL